MKEDRFWAIWRLVSFLLIVLIAFFGFREIHDRQVSDARSERSAQMGTCLDGNKRVEAIRKVLLQALADPPPETYDFIKDPAFRKGAIESGNRSRAQTRGEIERALVPRDCDKEIPHPPEE